MNDSKPSKRVLVVDDSLDTVHTMAFILRDCGHEVEYAINGFAALDIAKRQKPEVVFLDIGLPDFDGCVLARRLKQVPGLADTRIIAVTGRIANDRERALAAGCEAFFRKP